MKLMLLASRLVEVDLADSPNFTRHFDRAVQFRMVWPQMYFFFEVATVNLSLDALPLMPWRRVYHYIVSHELPRTSVRQCRVS